MYYKRPECGETPKLADEKAASVGARNRESTEVRGSTVVVLGDIRAQMRV